MKKANYEMLHDRFAHAMEWRFEVLLAVAATIMALYVAIYRVF